jgi:hypothetical protein
LGKCEIREDGSNKVLAQASQENFIYHFDVILLNWSDYQNLEITVKFKGVKGEEDQGGGNCYFISKIAVYAGRKKIGYHNS